MYLYEGNRSSIVKITPTWNVLPTFSRNFPPAKITTFTVLYFIFYSMILQSNIYHIYMQWGNLKTRGPKGHISCTEYNVPPFWGISQGGHFCFLIGPKNTNLVEDIEILLPIKFRSFQISGFRWEVENVWAIQRPGRPCCFSDRPEKHKLGRGRWDLASCQVSLNSVQRFQRRSWKCLSQSDPRTAILIFQLARKTQTW